MPLSSIAAAAALLVLAGQAGTPRLPVATVADAGSEGATRYLVGNLRVLFPRLLLAPGGGGPASATVRIENRSKSPDTLVGATVDGAGSATLTQGPVTIGPDAKVTLKPDGAHIAVDAPPQSWKVGDVIAGELVFERAGPLVVGFTVADAPPRP